MKKRVGIVTYHSADNFGAVMQAYALSLCINEHLDATAEIIDYKCAGIEASRYPGKSGNPLKKLLLSFYYADKRRKFDSFRAKHLPLSKEKYNRDTVSSCTCRYDVFVTGSDQVWNPSCCGHDTAYFLDFVAAPKRKLSYAASMGTYAFSPEESRQAACFLKDYAQISVREQSAVGKLPALGRQFEIMPDPVFLLKRDEWMNLIGKRPISGKYVFVYLIQKDVHVYAAAKAYAEKHHCRLIHSKKSISFLRKNSPADFLAWLYYAEAVFTNSFHGTAFSVIFGKPLSADIALRDGGVNNRIQELLLSMNLSDCIITGDSAEPVSAFAEEALQAARDRGIRFLERGLSEE